jgi:hypothetical protein
MDEWGDMVDSRMKLCGWKKGMVVSEMWWSLGSHVKASLPTGVRSPNPSTILCLTASQPKTVTSTPACHQRHPFIPLLVSSSFFFVISPFLSSSLTFLVQRPIHNSPTTPSAHRFYTSRFALSLFTPTRLDPPMASTDGGSCCPDHRGLVQELVDCLRCCWPEGLGLELC